MGIRTDYRNKTFPRRFAFKERQRGARKWRIRLCGRTWAWNTRLLSHVIVASHVLFIPLFLQSFTWSYVILLLIRPSVRPSVPPSVCPYLRPSVHLSIHPSLHWLTYSLIRSCICLFVYLLFWTFRLPLSFVFVSVSFSDLFIFFGLNGFIYLHLSAPVSTCIDHSLIEYPTELSTS